MLAELAPGHRMQFLVQRGQHAVHGAAIAAVGAASSKTVISPESVIVRACRGRRTIAAGAGPRETRSTLAVAAPDAGALADQCLPHRSPACVAGRAAPVGQQFLLEVAGHPVRRGSRAGRRRRARSHGPGSPSPLGKAT